MIVLQKHFEYRFSTRDETEEAIKDFTEDEKEFIRGCSSYEPFIQSPKSFCFLCGERLTIPCIMWHGSGGTTGNDSNEIWLHTACTVTLADKLLADAKAFDQLHK